MCQRINEPRQEEAHKNGRLEGFELGMHHGKDEEQKKWLTEGHGAGLCLSMAAHARELFRGAVLLEEAEVQTETTTWSDVSTQAAPRTDETASQTKDGPPRLLNDVGTSMECPTTYEMASQTNGKTRTPVRSPSNRAT